MRAIDVHAHVIVAEVLRDVAPEEGWRPALRRVDGRRVVEFDRLRINSMVQEFVEVDLILAETVRRAGLEEDDEAALPIGNVERLLATGVR